MNEFVLCKTCGEVYDKLDLSQASNHNTSLYTPYRMPGVCNICNNYSMELTAPNGNIGAVHADTKVCLFFLRDKISELEQKIKRMSGRRAAILEQKEREIFEADK